MSTVTLFYLTPNKTGGWVTFTKHLHIALKSIGLEVNIRKVTKKTSHKLKDFGYGLEYHNMSIEDACLLPGQPRSGENRGKIILVAVGKKFAKIAEKIYEAHPKDTWAVIHDPTESYMDFMPNEKTIVIRDIQHHRLPGSTFIRHPYARRKWLHKDRTKTKNAVSTCRIDYDKRIEIILQANAAVKEDPLRCKLYGFENRLYTKFKIQKLFPDWEQSIRDYPRTENAATDILKMARYSVDMSRIKGDGGGTQYTWLEAWDAEAFPIIHYDWLRWKPESEYLKDGTFKGYLDPMEEGLSDGIAIFRILLNNQRIREITVSDDMVPIVNCLAVRNEHELALVLSRYDLVFQKVPRQYDSYLKRHDPVVIGLKYAEALSIPMVYDEEEEWWEPSKFKVFKANDQSVDCYGKWKENSNGKCVFEDESLDGIFSNGADNWEEVVMRVTLYAKNKGTTAIEIIAI